MSFARKASRLGLPVGELMRRHRVAAWAHGVSWVDGWSGDVTSMLPDSYVTRPAINPDRHARIRTKHFAHALQIYLILSEVKFKGLGSDAVGLLVDNSTDLRFYYVAIVYSAVLNTQPWGLK